MKYRVTLTCIAIEEVEAPTPQEAESIARESVRLGDCDVLWVGVEKQEEERRAVAQ